MLYYSFILLLLITGCNQHYPQKWDKDKDKNKIIIMGDSIKHFPDFPKFKNNKVTSEDLIDLIVSGFPDSEKNEAKKLLQRDIFSKMTKGIENHPNPEKFYMIVYEKIVKELTDSESQEMLISLDRLACKSEISDITFISFSVAKAYFLLKNPLKKENAVQKGWVDTETRQLFNQGLEGLINITASLRNRLKKWQTKTKQHHPDLVQMYRMENLIIDHNLTSVETGKFDVAIGSLYDFLIDLNVDVQSLEID